MTTYSSAGPTVAWTDITDAMIAEAAPGSPELMKALRDNNVYLQEIAANSTSYTAELAHEHRGNQDGYAAPAQSPNLIRNATPNSRSDEKGTWERSGWSAILPNETGGGLKSQSSGAWAYHRIGGALAGRMRHVWGRGAPGVVSLFARAPAAVPTKGHFSFGIVGTQGGSSKFVGEENIAITADIGTSGAGSFGSGMRATAHFTDLATTWTRYWCRIENLFAESGELKYLITTDSSFDVEVYVTAMCLTPGRALYPFSYCSMEKISGVGIRHYAWTNLPDEDVPMLSYEDNVTNAVELKAL